MDLSITADAATFSRARTGAASSAALGREDFQLIDIFEHFFIELTRLRRVLELREKRRTLITAGSTRAGGSGQDERPSDPQTEPIPDTNEPHADAISACLTRLLQHYSIHVSRQFGSFGAAQFQEAQLLMAALADDMFIHEVAWAGRPDWQRNPIEAQLFGTSNSGNTVFDRIDDLLSKRDPATIELACINLYALRLKFQGRYRGTGQEDLLDSYRQRLFAFVTNRRPRLNEPDYRPFADAYTSTADLPDGASLPHVTRWVLAIVIFLAVYLLISHLVWSYNIASVLDIIDLRH